MNEYRVVVGCDMRYYKMAFCGDGCCSWQEWSDAEEGDTFFAEIDGDGNFCEETGSWHFGEMAYFYVSNGYVEWVI